MLPEGVDIDGLARQLQEDGVAYSNQALALDLEAQAPVVEALRPGHGIAVADLYPDRPADVRDLATALQERTGLDTMIVQAPSRVSAVSESYDRAALESAQRGLEPGLVQTDLLDRFYGSVDGFQVHWELILVPIFCLLIAAGWAAWRAARVTRGAAGPA
ncbi:DUF6676 family protein [Corynebacterium sp.]|uniref:Rv1476 family membrane protein n=1 Tax=Corynebacterium sp. TaxID=1720 RepID=UPI0026DB2E3B|nr:DUF6676 family protein [Corynebacterium sp.]MDO5031565.1 hypothetical protein [Corynebacterium sp.]